MNFEKKSGNDKLYLERSYISNQTKGAKMSYEASMRVELKCLFP